MRLTLLGAEVEAESGAEDGGDGGKDRLHGFLDAGPAGVRSARGFKELEADHDEEGESSCEHDQTTDDFTERVWVVGRRRGCGKFRRH